MRTLRTRVAAGMGANAFGQAVTIVIQLASLPLFLATWDLATYGKWLLISAVPSYVSMADAGMITAAGNQLSIAIGRGELLAANRIFQSALAFMLAVCTLVALLSIPAALLLSLPGINSWSDRIALAALVVTVLLTLFGGLAEASFRAVGKYAAITAWMNLLRLMEWGGWIVGLWMSGSFAGVAIAGLIVRGAGLVLLLLWSRRVAPELHWSLALSERRAILSMAKPALSFMAFPLTNALSFQGTTLVVGAMLGSASVAVFATYRTLARVAVQTTGILSHAMWVEFSLHYGRGGTSAVRKMYRHSAALGILAAMGVSLLLYAAGPTLLKWWTHGEISSQPILLALMLAYAAASGMWHIPRVLLLSTNRHTSLAGWSLLVATAALALAASMGPAWGLDGVAMAMLLGELAIAAICVHLAHRFLRMPSVAGESI